MSKLTYTMFVSFISNTMLSILKIVTGLLGKSVSLIADGIHTFSDLSLNLISMSDENLQDNPKLEHTINTITGVTILSLGLAMIYISIKREAIVPNKIVVIISFFTIIYKYILSTYITQKVLLYNNGVLLNNAHEANNDVISSIIVFISLILVELSDKLNILSYSDIISSIIVSLFIINAGFNILRSEINAMFGTKESDSNYVNNIKMTIINNKYVVGVDRIDIIKYGPYYELKGKVILNDNISLKLANVVAHNIEKSIKTNYPDIEHIVLNINPN